MSEERIGLGRGSVPRRSAIPGKMKPEPISQVPSQEPILLSPSDSVISEVRRLTTLLPACQISPRSLSSQSVSQSQPHVQRAVLLEDEFVPQEDAQRLSQDILSQAIQENGIEDDLMEEDQQQPRQQQQQQQPRQVILDDDTSDDLLSGDVDGERANVELAKSSSGVSSNSGHESIISGDFSMDYVSNLAPAPRSDADFRPAAEEAIPAAGPSSLSASAPASGPAQNQWRQQVAVKSGSKDSPRVSSVAMDLSEEVEKLRLRELEKDMDKVKMDDSQLSPDDFVAASYPEDEQAMTEEMTISIPELVLPPKEEFNRLLTAVGSMKFIVVSKNRKSAADCKWKPVDLETFSDVINLTLNRVISERRDCFEVFHYSSVVGGLGQLGLKIFSPAKLSMWRRTLTEVKVPGLDVAFNTFPKDCLTMMKTQVSMLLRSSLRYFDLRFLGHGLRQGNSKLYGKLTPTFSKPYGCSAQSKIGTSKAGWRLVLAEVDDVFLRSMDNYPKGHSFVLGAGSVQIRITSEKSGESPVVSCASEGPGIPSLIRSISHPIPASQLPSSGPGSRGGRGKGSRGGKRSSSRAIRLPPSSKIGLNKAAKGKKNKKVSETIANDYDMVSRVIINQ